MKIAHTITRFVRGGADENTLLTCNHQADAGHEVALIYGREAHPDIVAKLHPAVSKVRIAELGRPIDPLNDWRALGAMTRLMRQFAPEVVHTHTSKAGILGRIAAVRAGVPAIVHGVHILPFLSVGKIETLVYRAIEQAMARTTDFFIDVSDGMRIASIDNGVGTAANHTVIPSGMEVRKFWDARPFAPEELAAELGLEAPPRHLVVSAAVLEPRKRHVEFLDAFREVVRAVPGTHLAVTGAGPLEATIMARAAEYGIAGNVHLLGFRTDVERWMKSADVCTLASEREGLPRTVIQYVLCGRPVVATSLPGIDAVVGDGENGFIVGQPRGMAEPLIQLLTDRNLRARMALNSADRDLSAWDAAAMVEAIDRVYERILRQKGRLSA